MDLRYMGFDQDRNIRSYKFAAQNAKGQPTDQLVIRVDVGLFFKHRVGIQDGPALSAKKLTADLEANVEGAHELTSADLATYAAERTAREAERLEARRPGSRRRGPPRPGAASATSPSAPSHNQPPSLDRQSS